METKATAILNKGKIVCKKKKKKTHASFRPCNFSRKLLIKIYTQLRVYVCISSPFLTMPIQFRIFLYLIVPNVEVSVTIFLKYENASGKWAINVSYWNILSMK